MTPRLLVLCFGGLAGGGAMVCCDLNEGLEDESEADAASVEAEMTPLRAEADAAATH